MSTRQIMLNALKSDMFTFTRGALKVTKTDKQVCHCAMGALMEALEVPSSLNDEVFSSLINDEDYSCSWVFSYGESVYGAYPPTGIIPKDIQESISSLNDTSESYEPVIKYLESIEDWD